MSNKNWVLGLLACLALLPRGVLSEDKPCTIHDNGKFYDLNTLKSSKDFVVSTPGGADIVLNVCQTVKTELWGLKDFDQAEVGAAVRRAHGHFVLGKVNTTLAVVDSRPRLVLSDGSPCKSASDHQLDMKASAVIEFTCDTSIFGPGQPRLIAELPPGGSETGCAYVIEWKTHHACPASEGGGVWGFFATLAVTFLVLLMTYTVLGTLYNRFVLQLRGFDQIPQFSIESMKYHGREALDWVKDIMASYDVGGRGNGNPYGSVPNSAAPRSATNPVSHHTQASGMNGSSDIEENAGNFSAGEGSFIRPSAGTNRAAAFQRLETNPVSHQSQVLNAQSLSFSTSGSIPQSPPQRPPQVMSTPARRFGGEAAGSTQEERDFMLGNDDDDAEELADVTSPPNPSSSFSPRNVPASMGNTNPGQIQPQSISRNLDDHKADEGGTIRL